MCHCTSAGFSGTNCEVDVDECSSVPCQNGGTCVESDPAASPWFTCSCMLGFTDELCSTDVNECGSGPCFNGGVCEDRVDAFMCACPIGFLNDRCGDDFDECSLLPCDHGGTCTESTNSAVPPGQYECACIAGWGTDDCSVDVDECASQPCLNGGFCTESWNVVGLDAYDCYCSAGFVGDNCEPPPEPEPEPIYCETGTVMVAHGSHTCDGLGCSLACDRGYLASGDAALDCDLTVGQLEVETCDEVACPADSTGNAAQGCTCSAGFSGSIHWQDASSDYGGTCTPLPCTSASASATFQHNGFAASMSLPAQMVIQSGNSDDVTCSRWNTQYEGTVTALCHRGGISITSVQCAPRLAIILATDIADASTDPAGFELAFRGQLAAAIGVDISRIVVVGVDAGSVIVYFYIAEDSSGNGDSSTAVATRLQQRISSGSLPQFLPNFLRFEAEPDVDSDSDGIPNAVDNFPTNPMESLDTDGDGIGNFADDDDDGDGYDDAVDAFPLDVTEFLDTDGAFPFSFDDCLMTV